MAAEMWSLLHIINNSTQKSILYHIGETGQNLQYSLKYSMEHFILLDVRLRHPIIPKSLSDNHKENEGIDSPLIKTTIFFFFEIGEILLKTICPETSQRTIQTLHKQ